MTARRTGIASVASLAGLTLTVGLVHAVAPDWSRRMGFDVWNIGDAETAYHRATEIGHDLHAHGDRVLRQIEAGDHVAHVLGAGEITLVAAIDEIVQINDTRPGFLAAMRCANWGATSDRELVARYVLGKVWRKLADEPSRRAEVMARLDNEFFALTGKNWAPRE